MKQIKIGAFLSYISTFLSLAVGLLYTPMLIRLLGQSDYGLYSIVLSFAAYLSLMDLGVGNAIVRYISRNRAVGDKNTESNLIGQFLKFFVVMGIVTCIFGGVLAWYAPHIFSSSLTSNEIEIAKVMILILAFNFAISFPLNVFSAVLQAYERFVFLKITGIIRILLVPLLTLVVLQFGGRLVAMTVITTTVNLVLLTVGCIYCLRILDLKVSFSPISSSMKKEIIGYSLLIFITGIADKVYWQTDQLLLGILKDPETVAVYAIAIQFVTIFLMLSINLNSLFLPRISQIVTEENHLPQLNNLFLKISRIQFYILALAFSGFILFGKDFIILWAGAEYEQAYIIVIILMTPFFFDLIQNAGLVILQAKGLNLFRTVSLIICSILNIIISIPIIKIYGSIGTAIVTGIFVAIGNVILLNIYYAYKVKLDIKRYWKEIIRIAIPVVLLTLIAYYLKNHFILQGNSILELLIEISFFIILYILFIIRFIMRCSL